MDGNEHIMKGKVFSEQNHLNTLDADALLILLATKLSSEPVTVSVSAHAHHCRRENNYLSFC